MAYDTKAKARVLREQGLTIQEIADRLGIKKHTVWYHVQDMPLPERVRQLRSPGRSPQAMADMRKIASANYERKRGQSAGEAAALAKALVEGLDERTLLAAGAVAYWCEGSKSKPWRREERVRFINGDPLMIWLFVAFVRASPIEHGPVGFRISIHESADEPEARRFWCAIVGIDPTALRPTTFKKHRPLTVRKNVGAAYHGCLVVDVSRSGDLYRYIDAVARAVVGRFAH